MTTETQAPEGEPSDAAVELAAKAVYRLFIGADDHPWVEGGNSLKQCDARRYARAALAAQRQAAPTTPEGEPLGVHLLRLARKHDLSADFLAAIRQAAELLTAPAPTRSQQLREAGFTRRPSWKSIPGAIDDDEAAPVPPGMVLVPVEPTEDMLSNVDEEVGGHCHSCSKWSASWDDCRRVWAAMLAAAPQTKEPTNDR